MFSFCSLVDDCIYTIFCHCSDPISVGLLSLTCKRYKKIAEDRKLYPKYHLKFSNFIELVAQYDYTNILDWIGTCRSFSDQDLTKIQLSSIAAGNISILQYLYQEQLPTNNDLGSTGDIIDTRKWDNIRLFQVLDKSKINFTLRIVLYLSEKGFRINKANHTVINQMLTEEELTSIFSRINTFSDKSVRRATLAAIGTLLYQSNKNVICTFNLPLSKIDLPCVLWDESMKN